MKNFFRQPLPKNDGSLLVVIIILIISFFVLAVIDSDYRPAFADLTKVGVGGYLAALIPQTNQ